jgi:glycosyltransferase involved in cell wall biosynthesis
MPDVSVVIPTYNVARWLPEFLASLDAQQGGLGGFELIFVDDGSPDDSAAIVESWIAGSAADARVVSKPNGGLASARNAGLAVAAGRWVTFWDPDDVLAPPYAAEIREFLGSPEEARADLIVGRLVKFKEDTGRRSRHPLDHRFARGDRLIDLESEPDCFHLAANTALYRVQRLAEHDLTFDGRVVPAFEDGHLTCRYLSKVERPRVAVRSRARYLYRTRADHSSLVQSGWARDVKYLAQPRFGWLDLLRVAKADRGRVPAWTQYLVLYEIAWYFKSGTMVPSRTAWVPPELSAQFHEVLAEVLELLDPLCMQRFAHSASGVPADLIAALLIGGRGEQTRPARVTVDQIDTDRRLARLRYYFDGNPPVETFALGGAAVVPAHVKTRHIEFLGATMAAERIAWMPANDTICVELDGRPVPLTVGSVAWPRLDAAPTHTWPALTGQAPPAGRTGGAHLRRELVTTLRMERAARLLRQDELSAGTVGERCGYASQAAFGRVFTQYFGVGPGAYRRQHRERRGRASAAS